MLRVHVRQPLDTITQCDHPALRRFACLPTRVVGHRPCKNDGRDQDIVSILLKVLSSAGRLIYPRLPQLFRQTFRGCAHVWDTERSYDVLRPAHGKN